MHVTVHGGLHKAIEVNVVCMCVNISRELLSWMTLRVRFELAVCVIREFE